MEKIKLSIFKKSCLVIIPGTLFVSMLFFFSAQKILAQRFQDPSPGDSPDIQVVTGGYSIVSINTVIFRGQYYDNIYKSPFTTYFEYRKNNNNFDDTENNQQTIKIERPKAPRTDVDENAIYFTSQELKLFSIYYFRAVGYYNDKPDKKYFGNIISFNISPGFIVPYTYNAPIGTDLGGITSYTPPLCNLLNGICDQATDSNKNTTGTNTGGTSGNNNNTNTNTGNTSDTSTRKNKGTSGLVVCGIDRYPAGTYKDNITKDFTNNKNDANGNANVDYSGIVEPCTFSDVLKLINTIVSFLIFYLAVPLAAIMFAYAGFEMVTSGGSTEKKSKAKKIFVDVLIGLALAVASYLIIETVLSIAGYDQTWNWFGF